MWVARRLSQLLMTGSSCETSIYVNSASSDFEPRRIMASISWATNLQGELHIKTKQYSRMFGKRDALNSWPHIGQGGCHVLTLRGRCAWREQRVDSRPDSAAEKGAGLKIVQWRLIVRPLDLAYAAHSCPPAWRKLNHLHDILEPMNVVVCTLAIGLCQLIE